jgi:hypothetical protein
VDPTLLKRFSGWLRQRNRDNRGQRTAEGFRHLLEKLNIDVESVDVEQLDESGDSGPSTSELFEQYLQLFTKRFRYVQVIPIRPSYYAAPKYFLVHGSDSPHGAAFINDAVSTSEDRLYEETHEARDREVGQTNLFGPPERSPRYTLAELRAAVLEAMQEHRGAVKFIELRADLALRFGPDFREKDHKAAVRYLVEQGTLDLLTEGPIKDHSLLQAAVRQQPT